MNIAALSGRHWGPRGEADHAPPSFLLALLFMSHSSDFCNSKCGYNFRIAQKLLEWYRKLLNMLPWVTLCFRFAFFLLCYSLFSLYTFFSPEPSMSDWQTPCSLTPKYLIMSFLRIRIFSYMITICLSVWGNILVQCLICYYIPCLDSSLVPTVSLITSPMWVGTQCWFVLMISLGWEGT